jgi:hypothetical protein
LEIEGPHLDLLERKLEPEPPGGTLPADHCGPPDIEFRGFVQTGTGSEQPGLLESLKSGKILLGLTPQPTS